MKRLVLLLAAALLASPAAAKVDVEKEYSATYSQCLKTGDAARGVTPAMAGCINAELARQDKRLNTAYAGAMARLPAPAKERLRTAQRAWIKSRDAECSANLTGGTIDFIERPSCHLNLTIERAVELERMGKPAAAAPAVKSEARAFPYEGGIVDLLVMGPAAQTLYDRLPGHGKTSACGATGLHKGNGQLLCVKDAADYRCRVWLDVPKQSLTNAETDDC